MKKYTLQEWRNSIKKEVPFIDIKPFSHNIISIALGGIHESFGKEELNKAIVDFKLESFGWSQLTE